MPVFASMSFIALLYISSQEVVSRSTFIPVAASNAGIMSLFTYCPGGVFSVTPLMVLPLHSNFSAASANHASSPLADPESELDEQAESTSAKLEITLAKAKPLRLRIFNMYLPFLG